MAGARSILKAAPYRTPAQQRMDHARAAKGRPSLGQLQTTAAIVQSLVDRKKGLVTAEDVVALAKVTGVTKSKITELVETAREQFSGAAVEYVNIHKQATQAALANGDAKSLDVATRASQWAIEKISHEGKRVIDGPVKGPTEGGTKIMIGIQLGGQNPAFIEAETAPKTESSI